MIPELPKSCSFAEQVEFYKSLIARLDSQNEFHIKWYSHRKDPSTCWMCDQQILVYKVLSVCEDILQSQRLDISTDLESDSELEFESGLEGSEEDPVSTYNEPEYEVDEDGYRNKPEVED